MVVYPSTDMLYRCVYGILDEPLFHRCLRILLEVNSPKHVITEIEVYIGLEPE